MISRAERPRAPRSNTLVLVIKLVFLGVYIASSLLVSLFFIRSIPTVPGYGTHLFGTVLYHGFVPALLLALAVSCLEAWILGTGVDPKALAYATILLSSFSFGYIQLANATLGVQSDTQISCGVIGKFAAAGGAGSSAPRYWLRLDCYGTAETVEVMEADYRAAEPGGFHSLTVHKGGLGLLYMWDKRPPFGTDEDAASARAARDAANGLDAP